MKRWSMTLKETTRAHSFFCKERKACGRVMGFGIYPTSLHTRTATINSPYSYSPPEHLASPSPKKTRCYNTETTALTLLIYNHRLLAKFPKTQLPIVGPTSLLLASIVAIAVVLSA